MVSQSIPKPQRDPPLTLQQQRPPSPPPPPPPPPPPQMSTAPAKSQPLHNFSLTHLKWGKNQTTNHHRLRKPTDSPSADHHHHHRSSPSEAESDGGSGSNCDQHVPNQKPPPGSAKNGERVDEAKSNLVVRFPKGSNGNGNGNGEEGEPEEAVGGKPWNLRPRRYLFKSNNNENAGTGGGGGGAAAGKNGEVEEKQENHHSKASRLRGGSSEAENGEKKEKKTLWISLSRDEIEEDYFVLTGSKLPRRPKKRNRTVQKQLDNCFPGLWLSGITLDLYSVPEPSSKK